MYRLHSVVFPGHLSHFVQSRLDFAAALDPGVRQRLIIKRPPVSYGADDWEPFSRLNPAPRTSDESSSVLRERCSLMVLDHAGTALIEALSSKCPTIAFWHPTAFQFCKEASPIFERLCDVGILFSDAKAAAERINGIAQDVTTWWQDVNRQEAVSEFNQKFGLRSDSWRSAWEVWLRGELRRFNDAGQD